MPPKIKPAKSFPAAEEKLVVIASLKGDTAQSRVLVDFDNDLADKFWDVLEIVEYERWLAMGPKGSPPDADIRVLANLETGELEGIKGRDRKKFYDFFEPPGKRCGGARVYDVALVHYFGRAAIPQWMANEEE